MGPLSLFCIRLVDASTLTLTRTHIRSHSPALSHMSARVRALKMARTRYERTHTHAHGQHPAVRNTFVSLTFTQCVYIQMCFYYSICSHCRQSRLGIRRKRPRDSNIDFKLTFEYEMIPSIKIVNQESSDSSCNAKFNSTQRLICAVCAKWNEDSAHLYSLPSNFSKCNFFLENSFHLVVHDADSGRKTENHSHTHLLRCVTIQARTCARI